MSSANKIAVIGAGSWGTAMACFLVRNGHVVSLFCRSERQQREILDTRMNTKYLPGIQIPPSMQIKLDLHTGIGEHDIIILAIPSHMFHICIAQLKAHFNKSQVIVWLTKGLNPEDGSFLHTLVERQLGMDVSKAMVSGPSFALEVAKGMPTALTVVSDKLAVAEKIAQIIHRDPIRAYTSDDFIGVQLGGVLKNILAVAAGISDGLQLGANARAALMTRGMYELMRFGAVMGARAETLMGLTGLGDLILTCTDDQSRNRRLGLCIARGLGLDQAQAEIGQVIEALDNVALVVKSAKRAGIELPISEQVHAVVSGRCSARQAVQNLLQREQKTEY